ncbi:hypothetical protein AB0269_11245 [Microbacterium sp. NPDC077644]|uniref:hypothetical protein n=1 Tax=Microbacterium sp. NPDC077644 TaxID=3155055 RepID=UPI00344CC8C3
MYENFIYSTIVVEQERLDRENELKRIVSENPDRLVRRERRLVSRARGWLRRHQTDAAAAAVAADSVREIRDEVPQPAYAR